MNTIVSDAREWARQMVHAESRGSGDLDRAMAAVARRCGVTVSLIRSLHYRPPKDLWASCYFKIASAYRAECERQARKIEHEIAITSAKVGSTSVFVRAAAALAGAEVPGADASVSGLAEKVCEKV
jgi:hypothetical protein